MSQYDFSSILLSAQKTGNPPLVGTALSGSGVNIITLGASVAGVAFYESAVPFSGTLFNLSLSGSLFRIDRVYSGSPMALVLTNNTYTSFIANSAYATVPLSALGVNTRNITTPDSRRKWVLGYF